MSRIGDAFKNGKAFIPFITGGDPSLEATEEFIYAMEEAGADLIEIGVPFSDPVAEDAVVQGASERALLAGCTADKLFSLVEKVRKRIKIPLVFYTYANPIYTYGTEAFVKRCRESGVDGLIVPDIPFEEKEEILPECERYGVDFISVIVPTSPGRISMIAKEAQGFLSCAVPVGEAGKRSRERADAGEIVKLAREVSSIPCVLDAGSVTAKQVKAVAVVFDGVIARSDVVKLIAEYGADGAAPVAEYVRAMKNILHVCVR